LVLAVLEFGLELAFPHRSHSRFSTLPAVRKIHRNAPRNVIFPTELVIVMSLLLESVEILAPELDAVGALGLAAEAPLSVDFFDELLSDDSISFSSKARAAEYELKIAAATRILLA
jgi:hypothetical protein